LSRLAWVEPLRSMRPRNNTEAHGNEVIRRRTGCWRRAVGSGMWVLVIATVLARGV
jgi:hypothetical protein